METTLMENDPFYQTYDFWIFLIVGLGGLLFSILAFIAATGAKKAAKEARKTVKIQTITIELSELIHNLDKLEVEIQFHEARDFYSSVNRRIKRLTSPFKQDESYKDIIAEIHATLAQINSALNEVRPLEDNHLDTNAVYFAVQEYFSTLNGQLAELMGHFEGRTIELSNYE